MVDGVAHELVGHEKCVVDDVLRQCAENPSDPVADGAECDLVVAEIEMGLLHVASLSRPLRAGDSDHLPAEIVSDSEGLATRGSWSAAV